MNQNQKEIMANMMQTNLMMFANMLPIEERTNFVKHLIRGLQGFIPAPIDPPPPVPMVKPTHQAKGPPTDSWKPIVIPAIPEIKFEGKIWDSATMLPQDDMRLNAASPAFMPK